MPYKDKTKQLTAMRNINKKYRKQVKSKHIDQLFYAYLAGIIDGEGSLGLYIHKQPKDSHKLGYMYQPQIVITNTDYKLLKYLEDNIKSRLEIKPSLRQFQRIGGFTSVTNRGLAQLSTKPIYELRFRSMWQIKTLLEVVSPYMQCKRKTACLILEFCNIRLNRVRHKEPYGETEVNIYKQICQLSSRGRNRLQP